jgi:flagellar biosynthesis protein FlhB
VFAFAVLVTPLVMVVMCVCAPAVLEIVFAFEVLFIKLNIINEIYNIQNIFYLNKNPKILNKS